MNVIRIDPSMLLHAVPAVRGAMTEWMYSAGGVDPGKSVDPMGVEYSYGVLLGLQEEDIALAGQTGLNTIRCAIEHASLEDRDTPGAYREEVFQRIEQMLDWYAKYDIRAILDLHNALGREGGGDPRLWQHVEYQDRFVNVWKEIVRRFKDHPQVIAFEPLNEPEPRHSEDWDVRYAAWNNLAKRTTDAIRQLDDKKPIIINSIEYANASAFEGLQPTGDPNTVYSFHWYAPSAFHCQKRPTMKNKETYHYPDTYGDTWWDRNTIRKHWQKPLDFAARHKAPLFCGEFGCVSDTPEMEDMVWLLDIISLFDQLNITWTYYHYMFRTIEPYWMSHFDCNMFIYETPHNRLRAFDRKVSLLSDLMKLDGQVLRHADSDDPDLLVYAVRRPNGELTIYTSNKSRQSGKSLSLSLAGGPWAASVAVKRMAVGTGGYVDAPAQCLADGRLEVSLDPLTIKRLTVRPQSEF